LTDARPKKRRQKSAVPVARDPLKTLLGGTGSYGLTAKSAGGSKFSD
jgi:hypothetical protein